MAIDLNPIVGRAAAIDWQQSEFFQRLCEVAGPTEGIVLDWDDGAGEEWGRLLFQQKVVFYLCATIPLTMILINFNKASVQSILDDKVQCVAIDDMDEKNLYVDKTLLESVFGRHLSDGVNYENLSANDLWYATV